MIELTGMQEQMVLQVGVLREPSRADVTLVRPGSAVDVHVGLEVPWSRERLGAEAAFVGFFLWKKIGGYNLKYNIYPVVFILNIYSWHNLLDISHHCIKQLF